MKHFFSLLFLLSSTVPLSFAQAQSSKAAPAHLKYPPDAHKNGIQGTVKIRVYFNHKCEADRMTVIEGLGYGCDEEALRVVKQQKEEIEEKEKLSVTNRTTCEGHYTDIPIKFRIEDE